MNCAVQSAPTDPVTPTTSRSQSPVEALLFDRGMLEKARIITRPMRTDPSRILDTLRGYWRSEALRAAIDLGVFSAIGRGSRTAAGIAARCGARVEGIERLCDYLTSQGFLHRRAHRYRSAADTRHWLGTRSPHNLAPVARFFNEPPVTTAFARLGRSVCGGRRRPQRGHAEIWRRFARFTLPMRLLLAEAVADDLAASEVAFGRILEIGAGGAALGVELLRRNRRARLVVQDRASVVGVAQTHAKAAGIDRRVTLLPGDARTVAFGGPYDLVLMINALEFFDARSRPRILQRAHDALAPGGAIAVRSTLQDPARLSPPDAMAHDLMLLALQVPDRPLSARQVRAALRAAGFVRITRPSATDLVLAYRKR
jgi:predicted O-methyltransferase YrrM